MRKIAKIFACLTAIVLPMSAGLFAGCSASMYSEEQHIQRVRERAEERYLGEGSEYTGLEVYPLYNEYDELKYMLIELEPQGFMYVYIKEGIAVEWISGVGMYLCAEQEPVGWMPYRVKEGVREEITTETGDVFFYRNRDFFRDGNGQVIVYHQSHFKIAGIENERRYLLEITSTAGLGRTDALIPAVKRGEQYLDLVDGALVDYEPGMESAAYAIADIGFIPKPDFSL